MNPSQPPRPPRRKPMPLPPGEGIRLSKRVMAEAECSRAEAERLIEAGRVRVDGRVVREIPRRVHDHQRVEVDNPLAPAQRTHAVTLLQHKPAATPHLQLHTLLRADHHWSLDRSGLAQPPAKLDNLSPLEDAASGLVVWSQDPSVWHRLVDEGSLIEHELMADVAGAVTPEQLARMNRPPIDLPMAQRRSPRAQVSVSHSRDGITRLRMAFQGYWPGLALDLCNQAEVELLALKRLRLGRVALKDLPEGQWRGLMPYERF